MYAILRMTENALAAVAVSASISASLNVNIYTGQDNEEKQAPAIICTANSAREEFLGGGVWHVSAAVKVKEVAADSNTTSSMASSIFEGMLSSYGRNILNSYPNYALLDYFIEDMSNTVNGDVWEQTLQMDVVCALK